MEKRKKEEREGKKHADKLQVLSGGGSRKKPRGNDWQKKKKKRAHCTCNGGRYYIFSCLALLTYCCGRKKGKYVVTRTSHRKENRGLENRIYPKYEGGGGNRSGLALPLYPRLLLPREILLEGDIYFLFLYSGGTVHSTWNTGPPDSSYILNGSGREGKFLEMRKFLAENFSILLFLFCSPPGGALGEQRRPLSSPFSSSSSFPKSKVSPRMQIFKVRNGYWGKWTVGVVVLQQTSFRKEKMNKQYFLCSGLFAYIFKTLGQNSMLPKQSRDKDLFVSHFCQGRANPHSS